MYKIPFTGNPKGACVPYAVANLFNDKHLTDPQFTSKEGYGLIHLSGFIRRSSNGKFDGAATYVVPHSSPDCLSWNTFTQITRTASIERGEMLPFFITYINAHQIAHTILCVYKGYGFVIPFERDLYGHPPVCLGIVEFTEKYNIKSLVLVVDNQNHIIAVEDGSLPHLGL